MEATASSGKRFTGIRGSGRVFEVTARHGTARTGRWTTVGGGRATPAAPFAGAPRPPAPAFAALLLSETPIDAARPTMLDRGSIYRPRPGDAALAIPADAAKPSTLP